MMPASDVLPIDDLESKRSVSVTPERPTTILIDARVLGLYPGGFHTYTLNLIRGLELLDREGKVPFKIKLLIHDRSTWQDSKIFEIVRTDIDFLSVSEIWQLPKLYRKLKPDLIHVPTFSSFLPILMNSYSDRIPWVVTIHDVNHLEFGGLKERLYYHAILKSFALNALTVMSVSKFSAQEVSAFLGCRTEDIKVVRNSVNVKDFSDIQDISKFYPFLKSREYFVALSNDKPHKNLRLLVQAYARYRRQLSETLNPLPLVFSCGRKVFEDLDCTGIHFLGEVMSQEARVSLEGKARALFFPSLYEGFGLLGLEAYLAGTRSCISDIAPHREIFSDLSLQDESVSIPGIEFLDPHSVDSWAFGFLKEHQTPGRAPDQGISAKLAKRFSPYEMALDLISVYSLAMKKHQE